MSNLEARILLAIQRGHTQRFVASLYAEGLEMGSALIDWTKINAAIKARWKSPTAMVRVKTMAWGIWDRRSATPGGAR